MIFRRLFNAPDTNRSHNPIMLIIKGLSMFLDSPLLFKLMTRPMHIPKAHGLQSLQSNKEAAAVKMAIRAPTAWLSRPFCDA